MPITEASRHRLHTNLAAILDEEDANTLMEHLPPVGWADVATKTDLDHLAIAVNKDLDHLALAVKTDLDHLALAVKKDLDHLAIAVKKDLDHLESDLRSHMDVRFAGFEASITRQMLKNNLTMFGLMVTVVGLVVVFLG